MPPKGAAKAAPKEIEESDLTPGAIVLYRLRGYPPWPSLVPSLISWFPVSTLSCVGLTYSRELEGFLDTADCRL